MAAPLRQLVCRPTAKASCCPCPRFLGPHCPPQSLQHGWRPPASFSSSDGAGGIWIVCELRKRQTESLILRNFEKGTPDPISPCSAEHPPFPSSCTTDSCRKVNSQALPWPFLRMLLGQTTSAQRGTTLPSLLLTAGRTGRWNNPGSVYAEDSRLSGLNPPSKSAPNRDTTPGGREKVLPKRRHIAGCRRGCATIHHVMEHRQDHL